MNELEFTQLAATWMQQAIEADPDLPFRHARIEQSAKGNAQRRDLTLLDDGKRPLLTGEVKMPYRPDGHSPYRAEVVEDARKKARKCKCDYCFTWNVNRLVLWTAEPNASKKGGHDDSYATWDIVDVFKEEQLQLDLVQNKIRRRLVEFLREAARIVTGSKDLGWKRPDDRFVDALEAALEQPILLTTDALANVYKRAAERNALQEWMRDEQGWTIADAGDERGTLENLSDAARFANFSLVNKLVFHEALVRRYPHDMHALSVPKHIKAGDALRTHLEGYFQRAREVTNDYETVFGEYQYKAVAPRIPFYADPAVAYWRELIEQIHEFDFSRLDYEVIGSIFERLISGEERHKYGQYYTRAEVVDLINSFCIRTGRETVMDPACGGGTFLVRAYARKRELRPAGDHRSRLADLFGVDLSHFATHLTTINLATRDLIDEENYPQVARSDFFDVQPSRPLMNLPARVTAKGLGKGQKRDVIIPPLDAIVGNPPYVRQEDIHASPKPKKGEKRKPPEPGTKEFYQEIAEKVAGFKFSGRSDLHAYFWPHATEFLRDDGYLCLLTSSQWLDVDYGFRMQEYILRNFEIHAVFESVDEPWFVGARVATAATILRRQKDEAARMANTVRFVQLRRPIAEVLGHDGTSAGAMSAADSLRDKIMATRADAYTSDYRIRLINQGDLWRSGVKLGHLFKPNKKAKESQQTVKALETAQSEAFFGGKWGQYVRAPDLWFQLLDKCGDKLVPLAQVATVRFGVKSGKDDFFFPIDVSQKKLDKHTDAIEFRDEFGVNRDQVESGKVKIIACGEKLGEFRPLESKYLKPEVHNLKDIKGFSAKARDCRRMIFLTGCKKEQLQPHAQAYVEWGESKGWHKKMTCASRVTETREWHDLTGHKRGAMFWSMQQQYRHIIPANADDLICNHNLFDVDVRSDDNDVLNGVLNSSLTVLAKQIFGRPVGVEGNQKTEVIDVKMMLVPDVRNATESDKKRIKAAMAAMQKRKPQNLISPREFNRTKWEQRHEPQKLATLSDQCELDQSDRRELDDAVLRMLGFSDDKSRKALLTNLYDHLRAHFIQVRRKEEKANANKKKNKKKGRSSAGALAQSVIDQLRREAPDVFRRYPNHFIDQKVVAEALVDTFDIPPKGEPELVGHLIHGHILELSTGSRNKTEIRPHSEEQGKLLVTVIKQGLRGLVIVPHDADLCKAVHVKFSEWVKQRDEALDRIIKQQTQDEHVQQKVLSAVVPAIMAGEVSAAQQAN